MCSACCGNLLILLLDGLACCLACCFVLLAFRRPLVFICSLHSLPGVRWFHSCLWWLGCLERGFVRASGGWLRVVVGSVCFSPLFGLGWLWFPRLLLGCGLLAVVCCGGSFLLPSAHALSTWGQFMDKVMMTAAHLLTSLVTWGAVVSFVPLVARLPGAWFRPCFGWLAPGGGSVCFFPLFGLGWLWFPRLLLGCGLLAAVCCGGRFLLPSAHALSTWGQFMDKVIINHGQNWLKRDQTWLTS